MQNEEVDEAMATLGHFVDCPTSDEFSRSANIYKFEKANFCDLTTRQSTKGVDIGLHQPTSL